MNRLADAPSPYLRQHAENPVDWWPWSDAAFAEAARRDVPVFLSIGYATCHWCHVMAHESFEDPDVAAALNDAFVCVKVDREVRPDVDALYMAVCTGVLGHGGWPLTVVLTPDRRPFYVATYLPPRLRHGRGGVVELATALAHAWQHRRAEVEGAAADLTGLARQHFAPRAAPAEAPSPHTLEAADAAFRDAFDPEHGGFGHAPKFPTPHVLRYLLQRFRRTGQADLLALVETSLAAMMNGGIHDHVGGGFHRYSTDRTWTLPHFEKMLYDQAGLLDAYAEAAALTGRRDFAETAWAIHRYVYEHLRRDDGLLFAAEDADSARPDGSVHEGAFYVWTPDELTAVLGEADGALVARLYCAVPEGNFEDESTRRRTGENILHLTAPLRDLAPARDDPDAFAARVRALLDRLEAHRAARPRPFRDEKVLADWNGQYAEALIRAARHLAGASCLPAVLDASALEATAEAVLTGLLGAAQAEGGKVVHSRLEGATEAFSTAGDYASLALAFLTRADPDDALRSLRAARTLADRLLDDHWDEARGLFQIAERGADDLLASPVEVYDGAAPSANAVALRLLQRLDALTDDARYRTCVARMWEAGGAAVTAHPTGHAAWLRALDEQIAGVEQVVVVAAEGAEAAARALFDAARRATPPDTLVLLLTPAMRPLLGQHFPPLAAFATPNAGALAHVCHGFRCEAPISDPDVLRTLLRSWRP